MQSKPPRSFRALREGWPAIVAALALSASAGAVAGQVPEFKLDIPGLEAFECAPAGEVVVASPEEARQAAQLGSTARQALILGDAERARDLLGRAVGLDPSSPGLAYQYGRVLEDLGERRDAVEQYCAALAAGAEGEDAADARDRVVRFAESERRRIPSEALEAFEAGLTAVGENRMDDAEAAFVEAVEEHADFPEAEFNRALVLEQLGRAMEAAEAYRAYLRLRPDAPDGIRVSERIGQLQVVPGARPSSGSALALGMLLPGGGQFYTGRPLGGVALLAAAGGAAAAAFLVSETDVRCLHAVEPGASCPPEQVIGRTTSHPYRTLGLIGVGAVALGGAIEAFLHARGVDEVEVANLGGNRSMLLGPSLQSHGLGADVRFIRVVF